MRLFPVQWLSLFCKELVKITHPVIGILSLYYYLLFVFVSFLMCSFKVSCLFFTFLIYRYLFLPSAITCSFFYFARLSPVCLLICDITSLFCVDSFLISDATNSYYLVCLRVCGTTNSLSLVCVFVCGTTNSSYFECSHICGKNVAQLLLI